MKKIFTALFLRKYKRKEHGSQRVSGVKSVDEAQLMRHVADKSLKEEPETFEHFLVDSEVEKGRDRVYNFAMHTLYPKNLLEIDKYCVSQFQM